MGTRAAAFTAKIHNLQHYNARIQTGLLPLPSGDDVANTLKYFSQTLLSVLKDVPSISLDMLRCAEKDEVRTALFPSLDYKGLFHAIVELVSAVALVQHGAHALGSTILHTLACLIPFMEHEYIDTLPYLLASSMTLFPCSLHKDIIDMLCKRLLPFTFNTNTETETRSYSNMSTAAVLMMVFQYTDCSAYHCQVLECLMTLKKDVVKDLLCVIAHGTAKARGHAVELLFQYLPSLNPALLDRKGIGWLLDSLCTLTCLVLFPTFSPSTVAPSLMPTGSSHTGWKPLPCQRETCQSILGNEAVKMCFNHSIAIGSGEQPPPLYICEACAEEITKEYGPQYMADILLPMDKVSVTCENPDCKSTDKSAVATCFSPECANMNNHRPIRFCPQCVILYHNEEQGTDHMIHTTVPSPWSMDLETQSYMVEAVVSLLREAEPLNERHISEIAASTEDVEESTEVNVVEERQLLSRYGIWLLVGLCTPIETTSHESLGRLLSMLFQWFHYTACLPDDQAGNALERLKAEYIHGWLMEIVKSHFDVFVSCLLPHPSDCSKVGGHWETWASYTNQIKEGFKRLLCLVPYDIVTLEVWEYIMPFWMESFRHEAMETEFSELKILLSKILDPDLSPLGFNTKQMYKFLSVRFENCSNPIQEQALNWLQILTMLEVPVPLELLFDMFTKGVESTRINAETKDVKSTCHFIPPAAVMHRFMYSNAEHFRQQVTPESIAGLMEGTDCQSLSDTSLNLCCYILMLDILIKQLELQEISAHRGLKQEEAQNVMLLMRDMLKVSWVGTHTCTDTTEGVQCTFCEICAIWFQLCLLLIEFFSPVMEVTMADVMSSPPPSQPEENIFFPEVSEIVKTAREESVASEVLGKDDDDVLQKPIKKAVVEEVEMGEMVGELSPIRTAAIQEFGPTLDTGSVIPMEDVVPLVANEVTLTDDDVARAQCTVVSPVLMDENDESLPPPSEDPSFYWETAEGRFKFTIEELPPQQQLLYALLKAIPNYEDADVLYHILSCLKVMCLHSEILNKAASSQRGFVIWCQENLLITNLWKLLQGEFSHIAQLATYLILHCVTLPCGSDVFWKTLEKDFHSNEWKVRYAAVEKVTMIAHFFEPQTVKNSPLLQAALANAFCYLVHCLDDIQPTVSQRALLNLETVKTTSLKLFVWCLEVQFDCNLVDRPMILQTISQIHNHISNRRFLSWDFFLTRFDTLFLEAQVMLERTGDVTYIRDLKNSNTSSEMFQKKLKRAHDALSLLSSSRSLTASLGAKWPYQRALSAPGAIFSRQEKFDKEKFYERQSSAPVLKRKGSRLIGSTVASLTPLQHFPNSFFTDSHLKETMQEESQFLNVLHRAMDLEEHDRETLHLLIYLLMQFLSRPDPVHRSEDKVSRSQHMVLRHLNILLGYSQTQNEGKFLIPPPKVRASAAFNAFLMSMPKVLDYNFSMASTILGTCLSLLVCCPAPQKYPNEQYPPLYTIWLLDPHCRHAWLLSALVILYKYHYDSYPFLRYIQWLITIVLNTLKAQRHKCKLSQDSLLSPLPFRSRDFSTTPSADIENIHEREKESFETGSIHEELIKPFIGSGIKLKGFGSKGDEMLLEQVQKTKEKGERYQWKSWKTSDRSCSSDGEDAEPELEAIPESPKSEDSLHEPFTSEFSSVAHSLQQACVQLVQGSDDAEEHVVITDPWPKSTAEEASVLSTDNQRKVPDEPQNSESCDTDSSHVIEKSAIESMEKKTIPSEGTPAETAANHSALENLAFKNSFSEHNILEGRHSMPCGRSEQNFRDQFSNNKPVGHVFEVAEPKLRSETAINSSKDHDSRPLQWREHTSFNQSLSLPDTEVGGKITHSKYPHPKLFHSKKKDTKALRKAEILGSENLTTPLFRPPLERLLPIGMPKKVDTPTSPTSPFTFPLQHYIPSHNQPLQHSSPSATTTTTGYSFSRELCEDKAVQAGGGGLPFELPPPERLLPIGPPPSRKEWFYAPIFKTSFSESMEGPKVITNPQTSNFESENFPSLSESIEGNELSNVLILHQSEDSKNCTYPSPMNEDKPNNNKFLRQGNVTEGNEKDTCEMLPKSKSQPVSIGHNNTSKGDQESEKNQALSQPVVLKTETALNYDISNSYNSIFEKDAKDTEEPTAKQPDFTPAPILENENIPAISSIAEMLQEEKAEIVGFSSDYDVNLKHVEKVATDEEVKCKLPYRQRKQRKPGLSSLEPQRSFDYQNAGIRRMRKVETGSLTSSALMMKRSSTSQGSPRFVEDTVVERCTECGTVLEEYSDEELGLCVVILATFVHREPAMAAPFLPRMLKVVTRIASSTSYPWQSESNVHLPGGSVSVARQFLRCTLHQLAPNGIFSQIFQSHLLDADFFKTMAAALADFAEVNQVTPLLHVFEHLNDKKHLHQEIVFLVLDNVATYLDCLPLESNIPPWCMFLQQLDTFFRKLLLVLPVGPCQLNSILHIMLAALKMPFINSAKSLLDPFSKLLSHAIQHSELDYQQLSDLCRYCYRNVAKERDKLILTRTAVFELVQALKFKSSVPDANLLILVQFVLEDVGGTLGPNIIVDGFPTGSEITMFNTSSSECMRQYLNDALEFVADVHTLNKVKNMLYGSYTHLNEETLGGQLKAGIAQYLAIEISKGNGRDNRAIGRYLPWLYHPPTVLQQGPKEFIDCVSHIRLLSWLLLGALTHSSLLQNTSTFNCQPIPLEANSHIAEHIQMILTGFADQSKVSVLHMSSLFHAFILCQLWTMYCEHMVALNPPGSEQSQICALTLTDFWAKVTPGILQLVCHSKILAEMVSLHFLSLMEALMECNSTILARLLPMWTPVLYTFQGQLPSNLHVRLRNCISSQPPSHTREDVTSVNTAFLRWLQRLQFKMGQIELQSSTVAQFYTL